jgi:hypothetical protein
LSGRLPFGTFTGITALGRATTAQHYHVVRYDFDRSSFVAFLIFPFPALNTPFDEYLLPFAQVLSAHLTKTTPGDYPMPFCSLLVIAILITPLLGCGEGESRDGPPG